MLKNYFSPLFGRPKKFVLMISEKAQHLFLKKLLMNFICVL